MKTLSQFIQGMSLCLAVACGGDSPKTIDAPLGSDGGNKPACTNAAFDPCTANTQCTSNNCHLFTSDGFQVCTSACTPGDNNTCPVDKTGAHATCNNMGICKPAGANDCMR